MKSTKYRGTYAQFFLRCGLDCFFSSIGSAVFLNIGLTQTCIAIDVPPSPTWEPYQSIKRTTRKCKTNVRNKMFECATLLKIEVIEYGKNGFINGLKCILKDKDFNERVQPPSHTLPTSLLAPSVKAVGFQRPPPPLKQVLWVQPFLYIYFVVFSSWQCVVYDSNFDLHLQLQYNTCNKENITMTYTISRRDSVICLADNILSMYIELL